MGPIVVLLKKGAGAKASGRQGGTASDPRARPQRLRYACISKQRSRVKKKSRAGSAATGKPKILTSASALM